MSKFSNLLRLLILLRSNERMKTKDIAGSLGISERMVRKYMDDLEQANINIQSIPGPTGGYELVGYDYLLNLDITNEESVSLQLATQRLKEQEFTLIDQLEELNDKIKIINDSRKNIEDYSINSVIKYKPLYIEKENELELKIQTAHITKSKLRINYHSLTSGDTTRVVRPYSIVSRNNIKYLVAYCEKRQKILTFKIIRIIDIEILDEKFDILEDFDVKQFMKGNLGLFNDETINLKLLIKPPFSYSVSEGIYADNQKILWNDDKSIIFEAKMTGKDDIIRWILSMRTFVEIIEPISLKEEIKLELQAIIDNI